MKPYLPAILFLFLYSSLCYAQTNDKIKNNGVSLELGKSGLIYNLTYDHRFKNKDFGFRLSAGSNLAKYLNAVTFGGGNYYLIGKGNGFLELGADLSYLSVDEESDDQKRFNFIYPDYSIKTYYASLNFDSRNYGNNTLFRTGLPPGIIE